MARPQAQLLRADVRESVLLRAWFEELKFELQLHLARSVAPAGTVPGRSEKVPTAEHAGGSELSGEACARLTGAARTRAGERTCNKLLRTFRGPGMRCGTSSADATALVAVRLHQALHHQQRLRPWQRRCLPLSRNCGAALASSAGWCQLSN